MGGEWRTVRLGDVTELLTGFPFKSEQYTDDLSSPRLLRGDNVAQGTLRWDGVKRWPRQSVDDIEQYWLQVDDVILAMDRPWIEAGLKYAAVQESDLPSLLVQRVARLRGTGRLETRFLKYVIGSRAFTEYVLAVETGTAVPHISSGQIRSFEFLLPPLTEQRAIAHILGTLDDKIELNRRMNATLEEMARALFKSWFVDFDPVRAKIKDRDTGLPREIADLFPDGFEESAVGDVPKGWRVGTLGEAIIIHDSKRIPLSSRQRAERKSQYPYYGAASVMDHIDDYLFDGVYVLMGEDGSVVDDDDSPVLQYVWGKFWANNHAHVLTGRGSISVEHLLLFLKTVNIRPYVTGAVQPKLNQGNLCRVPMVFAPDSISESLAQTIAPVFARIRASSDESRTLAALRDALLPKLISGAVRVGDAERFVGAAQG